MPPYEWSSGHSAWVKECSQDDCVTGIYIGTTNEEESVNIFLRSFGQRTKHSDGLQHVCKNCIRDLASKREKVDREAILKFQNGKCGVCKKDLRFDGASGGYVDHDHKTNEIRGILCPKCNTILHGFETPERLRAFMKYLAQPPARKWKRQCLK